MESIAVAAVAALAPTIAAVAAWRRSREAAHQTNGLLHEPLNEIRTAVLDTQIRMTRVENALLDHVNHHL